MTHCCPVCGGRMEGDGFTRVVHCEHVEDLPMDVEADADPIYCLSAAELQKLLWEEVRACAKSLGEAVNIEGVHAQLRFLDERGWEYGHVFE